MAEAAKAKEAPKKPATGTAAKPAGEEENRPARPHHVVAQGHVFARSAEFNIPDARRFVVWFKDASPEAVAAASGGREACARAAANRPWNDSTRPGAVPARHGPPRPPANSHQAAAPVTIQKPGTEPRKPINLKARSSRLTSSASATARSLRSCAVKGRST